MELLGQCDDDFCAILVAVEVIACRSAHGKDVSVADIEGDFELNELGLTSRKPLWRATTGEVEVGDDLVVVAGFHIGREAFGKGGLVVDGFEATACGGEHVVREGGRLADRVDRIDGVGRAFCHPLVKCGGRPPADQADDDDGERNRLAHVNDDSPFNQERLAVGAGMGSYLDGKEPALETGSCLGTRPPEKFEVGGRHIRGREDVTDSL